MAVAHGSRDPRAAATVEALLGLVRQRAGPTGLEVRAAYLGHSAPSLGQVLGSLDEPAVVLPLLLTAAYHSKADIPGVLRETRTARPWMEVTYGRPLGPHPLILAALDRRLAEAVPGEVAPGQISPAQATPRQCEPGQCEPGQTAVVLAAAGSSDATANAIIADIAAQWRAARGWQAVIPAYASAASPTPGQAVAAARRGGAQTVLVATYLLAPGLFADQIRRDSLAAGAAAVSDALGAAPELADVVLGRYAEALADGDTAAAV